MAPNRRTMVVLLAVGLLAVAGAATQAQAALIQGVTIFTDDASSGISSAKTYTHALDFPNNGSPPTIGGVPFTDAGLTGPNWALIEPNATAANDNTGVTPGGGTHTLLQDFYYRSGGGNSGMSVSGLTAGQTYEARVYFRQWGGNRTTTFTVTDGKNSDTITYDPDAVNQAGYLAIRYTAQSDGVGGVLPMGIGFGCTQGNAAWHHYGFTNELVAGPPGPPPQVTPGVLLTDSFTAAVPGVDTLNINQNIPARQGGPAAPVLYRKLYSGADTYKSQVGNNDGSDGKTILDGGNVLLAAFGGGAELLRNFKGTDSQGGLSLKVDIAPDVRPGRDGAEWAAINIGYGTMVAGDSPINQGSPHFGVLFRENGFLQAFDGSTNVTLVEVQYGPSGSGDQWVPVELIMTDPTDGNPFDGVGQTDIDVLVNGLLVFEYTKAGGGYADNYINFESSGIGDFDNLVITNLSPEVVIPEPATLILGAMGLSALAGYVRRRRGLR